MESTLGGTQPGGTQPALPMSAPAPIMGDLNDYFDQCDNDHDGRILYNEFLRLLEYLGGRAVQRDWPAEFRSIADGRRTSIDIHDFFQWWMK